MSLYYRFVYWCIISFLKFVCRVGRIQCHGKRKVEFAYEWCQKRAFHDTECTFWDQH